jgi:hypothetical protein
LGLGRLLRADFLFAARLFQAFFQFRQTPIMGTVFGHANACLKPISAVSRSKLQELFKKAGGP